jgi:hypothetical protein
MKLQLNLTNWRSETESFLKAFDDLNNLMKKADLDA